MVSDLKTFFYRISYRELVVVAAIFWFSAFQNCLAQSGTISQGGSNESSSAKEWTAEQPEKATPPTDESGPNEQPLPPTSELTEDELRWLKEQEQPKNMVLDEKLPFSVPSNFRELPEYAMVVTSKGPFEIKLFREKAPISVANFRHLVNKGTYNGLEFHRFVPGFVIQGGDPTGTTNGGPGWTLPAEMDPDIHHVRGTLGWARSSGKNNPERRSNGSQFYICLQPQPRLDGFYSAFAVVVQGMENVEKLRQGDRILQVKFPKEYRERQRSRKTN